MTSLAMLPLLSGRNAPADAAAERSLSPVGTASVGFALLTERADVWTLAREIQREEAVRVALQLGQQAAERERIAAAQAAEAAAAAAAAATSTTAPPTTRPPATTARPAPATTRPPATTARPAPATTRPPATTARPAPTTAAPPPAPRTPAPPAQGGDPTPAQWAALRQCESGGNYGAIGGGGAYRGAYQFARSTWDSVARMHGYLSHLVGVDPAAAAPADQDAMALALYRMSGWSPWPSCGAKLG